MLGEGTFPVIEAQSQQLIKSADGIHVDMNHLKKGEVK